MDYILTEKLVLAAQGLGINYSDLFRNSRVEPLPRKRFAIWYCLRFIEKLGVSEIGKEFNKSHTSVIYGIRAIEESLEQSDKQYLNIVKEIFERTL